MKEKEICSVCGKELNPEELTEFEGALFCNHCLNETTAVCSCCNARIRLKENYGNDATILCKYCYYEYYTRCERCNCLVAAEDANYFNGSDLPYCDDCFDEMEENSSIHDYSYKPVPLFYGVSDLYYGVELEIDCAGERCDYADMLRNIANAQEEHLYCKHDGSIYEGFELVSHPMTLDYHSTRMPWEDVFQKAISLGYRSHNTATCGLHIHINRTAFGKNYDEQETGIARIVYFVEANWNELVKFSRRNSENLMRWSAKYGIADNIRNTYDKTKKGNLGRYVAVNLQNYHTVELRIFRGTLNRTTFYAALQLVDEICRCAMNMTDREMEGMSWLDFVSNINQNEKPELIQYLKLKRLYVNDPVETEVNA